jgi:hypothetical protein
LSGPSANPGQLNGLIANLRGGGLTSLYDPVYHACAHPIFETDQQPHRSALILFSDGEDNLSRHDLQDTIAEAELRGVSIYTISTHDPQRPLPGCKTSQLTRGPGLCGKGWRPIAGGIDRHPTGIA